MRPVSVFGWESGDTEGLTVTGAGLAVNGTAAITGSYGLDCNVASGTNSRIGIPFTSASGRRWLKFNIRVPTGGFPSSRRVIYRMASATAAAGRPELAIVTGGDLSWGTNNAQTAVLATLAADMTYCLEIGYDTTASVWAVRLDEVTILDWTSITNQTVTASDQIGAVDAVAAAIRFYVDDLVTDFEEWPGRGYVSALPLTLASDNAGWTPNTGSDKTAVLTETPPDDDTTYLLGPTTTGSSTDIFWSFSSIAADIVTVRAVQARIRLKRDGATNGSVIMVFRDGTLTGHSANSASQASTSAYTTNADNNTVPQSPWGPGWTRDRLSSLQIGLRNNSANKSRVTSLVVEVLYDRRNSSYHLAWPIMLAGFEPADFSEMATHAGSQSNAAVSTSNPRSGARSFRSNPANGAQSRTQFGVWADWWTIGQVKEAYAGWWMYVAARHASGNIVIGWIGGARVLMDSGGGLLVNSTGDNQTSSATAAGTIPTGSLTHICVQTRLSDGLGNNGWIKVWVNDILTLTMTACNPGTSLSGQSAGIGNNVNAPSAGYDAYYDDYVSSVGIRRVHKDDRLDWLTPTDPGEGFAGTNWTYTGDTDVANTTDDGISPDDDTTYALAPNNTTDTVAVDMSALDAAAARVLGYLVGARIKRNGGSNDILALGICFDNGQRLDILSITSTASYADTGEMVAMSARGHWMPSDVGDAEISMRSSLGNQTRITRLYATIWYSRADDRPQPRVPYPAAIVGV